MEGLVDYPVDINRAAIQSDVVGWKVVYPGGVANRLTLDLAIGFLSSWNSAANTFPQLDKNA